MLIKGRSRRNVRAARRAHLGNAAQQRPQVSRPGNDGKLAQEVRGFISGKEKTLADKGINQRPIEPRLAFPVNPYPGQKERGKDPHAFRGFRPG